MSLRARVFAILLGVPLVFPAAAAAESARHLGTGPTHTCVVTAAGAVKCWGLNDYGQLGDGTTTNRSTPVAVAGLSGGVVAVETGQQFSCALKADGGVQCWGRNQYGKLGDGTTTDRLTPTDVSGLTAGVVELSVGDNHACIVLALGGIRCWGQGTFGQLGNSDPPAVSGYSATPVTPVGISTGIQVSAAAHHTCAVTSTGTAKCWGYNDHSQLGDGTTTQRNTPVTVSGVADALWVTAGPYFTCLLTTGGGVKCWGDNQYGQLGDGTTTDRTTPTTVTGLGTGVATVSAGSQHACAVTSAGAAKCWGNNGAGQLGDGTTTNRSTPVDVTVLGSLVALVGAGGTHSCALVSAGAVLCWGGNNYGQLGNGTTTNASNPSTTSGLNGGGGALAPAGVTRVARGDRHACAVTAAGSVLCWGKNASGQLGDGTTTDRLTPVLAHGLASGVVAVTAGADFSCALTSGGAVKCWGYNASGQLADGTTTTRLTPHAAAGLTSGVSTVSAGAGHACALTTTGVVKCWGQNNWGEVGDGTTTNRNTPVTITLLGGGTASGLAAGAAHTCAVTTGGAAQCWGSNFSGQIGDNSLTDRLTPVAVTGLASGVSSITSSLYNSCVVTSAGGVKCWGANASGQIGDGTLNDRFTPVAVTGLTSGVSAVVAGFYHTCALTSAGAAKCWGDNYVGAVGDGTTTDRSTPVTVLGLKAGVTRLAAGNASTCAVTARGGLQCWGYNSNGQLGDGTTTDRSTPGWVRGLVAGTGMIEAGQRFSCKMTLAGGVQCWGDNRYGQLGDGTTEDRLTPVDVSGLTSGVVSIALGNYFACALTNTSGVKCWGRNSTGQLGDGTLTDRYTPVDVSGRTAGTAAIGCGLATTCAVTTSGGVQCWGLNTSGQVGDGTITNRTTPVWVESLTEGATGITVGNHHSCALTAMGGVRCWGANASGQLGDGSTAARSAQAWVSYLRTGVAALASGSAGDFTCALTGIGMMKCWGENTHGQVGDATTTNRPIPIDVTGLNPNVVAIAAGLQHTCLVTTTGGMKCWGDNAQGQLGNGTTTDSIVGVSVSGFSIGAGMPAADGSHTCVATVTGATKCWGDNLYGQLGDGTLTDRLTPATVKGIKLFDDYDADSKADVAVYRPSTGTWFSLDSSTGNSSYRMRGWGVDALGDRPVAGDFDGDGIVDPTVFRPSVGTWFVLKSSSGFTAWEYFGWGTTGDTPVPSDYDGDGITDAAVYRPSTGTWYVKPSGGATSWEVVFGNASDVPVPGHYDADGKADIAVYRPSTGTWFVLTSASDWTSYWFKGWGVDGLGDTPAPGDYDGDGKLDLCVFRPSTGTWFILESKATYATWNWIGWGASGDTVAPNDYDGDGITDVAVYRPSNFTWYILPSSGDPQWSIVFGRAGDLPLIRR